MGKSCDMLLLLVNGHEDGRDIAQRTGEVSHSFEPKPEGMAKYDVYSAHEGADEMRRGCGTLSHKRREGTCVATGPSSFS